MMKKLNKEPRNLVTKLPAPPRMTLAELQEAINNNTTIIDARGKLAFAGGHIPRSLNIQNNNSFSTWAGWMMSYDKPFALIAAPNEIDDIVRKLARIGLDSVVGYFPNIEEWSSVGHELETIEQLGVHDLYRVKDVANYALIDVRGYGEYAAGHIPGAINIHAGYLEDYLSSLPAGKTLALYCAGGDRSSIASSLLRRHGIKNFVNITGGFNAWLEAGLPVETSIKSNDDEALRSEKQAMETV
jgi:hydroxyacylglutathione hydrolase